MRFDDETETGLHLPDIEKRNNGELDRGFKLMQRASERGEKIRRFNEPAGEGSGFEQSEMKEKPSLNRGRQKRNTKVYQEILK